MNRYKPAQPLVAFGQALTNHFLHAIAFNSIRQRTVKQSRVAKDSGPNYPGRVAFAATRAYSTG